MKRFLVQLLILSPYFYVGSIYGKEMSDKFFDENKSMVKYKYLVGYCYFMVGFVCVFIVLGIIGFFGGSEE